MKNTVSLLTWSLQLKMRKTINKLITKYLKYMIKYLSLELGRKRKAAGSVWDRVIHRGQRNEILKRDDDLNDGITGHRLEGTRKAKER